MASPLSRGGFLETLKQGQLTVGTFLGLASPLAAEVAAVNGVDWVLLDLEHGLTFRISGNTAECGMIAITNIFL